MKPKKKSKLRNAEYYDIQSVLDELYEKSKSGCKFVDLIPVIASEENIKNVLRQKDTSKGIFFIYNEDVKYEDIVKQIKEIYNYKTDERVQDLNAGGVLYLH